MPWHYARSVVPGAGMTLDPTEPAFPFGYGLDHLTVQYTKVAAALI